MRFRVGRARASFWSRLGVLRGRWKATSCLGRGRQFSCGYLAQDYMGRGEADERDIGSRVSSLGFRVP